MSKSNLYLILTLVVVVLLAACKSTDDREKICRTAQPEDVLSCLQNRQREISERAEKQQQELLEIK